MKNIVIGILAHVDAGKTTLSEALLYQSGSIRKAGRVDNQDAFLDTYALEKERGITIFSKQAVFDLEHTHITLMDTPGHVDFSAEMERTLQVLDYAILVISAADGVQGHTKTLWGLLKRYQIPVFLFVNKMDQAGADAQVMMDQLKEKLDSNCVDFSKQDDDFYENIAMCDEYLLEQFLMQAPIEMGDIANLISERKIYPCFFGSALKMNGINEFMQAIDLYITQPAKADEFGAKVFKITRDAQGNRLTHLKITSGALKVKAVMTYARQGAGQDESNQIWEEKVNQIRIYSGEKFVSVSEADAGCVCAVTGLTNTYPGQAFGIEKESVQPFLTPVFTYKIILPQGLDALAMLPKLRELEEEEPQLHIVWKEEWQEIQAQVMGEVQMEVLKSLIWDRFHVEAEFGTGNIVYHETIANTVEGVGHFEPLRHYAEVHLLLEPGEPGSGLQFETQCSEDMLAKNWQKLVLTHLEEREHRGVLTGSQITDMKITLVGGRAHPKHTEGGDFRQATYRAVRQGLMQAESILLEPYYSYKLEIPEQSVGRAMNDLNRMNGTFRITHAIDGISILEGRAPVATMHEYQKEVTSYTKGFGRLTCVVDGYDTCHDADEVINDFGYDPLRDLAQPADSVFCAHGAGFIVAWDEVADYMHIPAFLENDNSRFKDTEQITVHASQAHSSYEEMFIDQEEVNRILEQTYGANKKDKIGSIKGRKWGSKYSQSAITRTYQPSASQKDYSYTPKERKEEYLLVDGYNIIHAWPELEELARINMDSARGRLLDILCNYQGVKKCTLIVVFDAYQVKDHDTEYLDYHNIHVVFTKEAETADQYIEKFTYENAKKYDVTVATSDGLEQIIIRGNGSRLMSAREFLEEIENTSRKLREDYLERKPTEKHTLIKALSEESRQQMEQFQEQESNKDEHKK